VLSSAVEQGLGIAYGPIAFFKELLAQGKIKQVLGDYDLPRATIYSLYARSRYIPAKINAFNTFMEQYFVGKIS
jgi:DNA-binding transcriptional LysR family regulator